MSAPRDDAVCGFLIGSLMRSFIVIKDVRPLCLFLCFLFSLLAFLALQTLV